MLARLSRPIAAALFGCVLVAGSAACGNEDGPTPPTPGSDAGPMPPVDAGSLVPAAELTLGTGELAFAPVAEGQVLPLVHGFQGLQHVWVSVRARDFDPDRAIITLSLDRVGDGRPAADDLRVRLPFDVDPAGAYVERVGLQLVVLEPNLALGEQLRLTAAIDNPLGAHATASAHITVVWEENL